MKFEQFPQATPEEPAKPSKKKGLAILGLVGALAGGLEATAHADTGKPEKSAVEKKESREMTRLKQEADARWDQQMFVRERLEGKTQDGRTVLGYAGKRKGDRPDVVMEMKGYTVLDEGDLAKEGDGQAIDLKYERNQDTGDSWIHDNASGAAELWKKNPVWEDISKNLNAQDIEEIARRNGTNARFVETTDLGWWWANALQAVGEKDPLIWNKADASKKALDRRLDAEPESIKEPAWLRVLREKGADTTTLKDRIRGRFDAIYNFQPSVKKR